MRPSDFLILVGQRCGHPSRVTYLVDGCFFFIESCVHPNARPSETGHRLPAMPEFFAKRDQDLPGYWVTHFVRAVVTDPARCRDHLTLWR
jgi:hypothetical protein